MWSIPSRERFSEPEKDALIAALGAAMPRLKARRAALEGNAQEPRKDAHHSRVPPAQTPKPNSLEELWMPFTANKHFKQEPRIFTSA